MIRNSTLRDLIAIAYGVERWRVVGGPEWLDSPRYDVRALSQVPVSDPETLDLLALQAPVTQLLASRFGLEIHVNRRCQSPCGKVAVTRPTHRADGDARRARRSPVAVRMDLRRHHPARVHLPATTSRHCGLWLWRIAALKFAASRLRCWSRSAGGWGFPSNIPTIRRRLVCSKRFARLAPSFHPLACTDGAAGGCCSPRWWCGDCQRLCARWMRRQLQSRATARARRKPAGSSAITDDIVRRPGFFNSALLTACAMLCVAIPVLAGALEDRQRHYELLVSNSQSLRDAAVTMTPAAPGMGTRYRIDADRSTACSSAM